MNRPIASPKILVAPLDWGLGHATRCVPVVRELLRQGCTVLLAGESKQKALLQQEFPHLPFLELPGYRIEYASSGWGLAAKIVAQIPKLLSAMKDEQEWLKKVVEEEKIDAVISDNRYGLYHADVHAVFVTHQLRIKAPVKLAEDFLQEMAYSYINKFDECWVPDAEGNEVLAGELSHPEELPSIPLRYVGTLSRFGNAQMPENGKSLLILLSGPEPQRTLLEESLLDELKEYEQPVVLVRGLPGEAGELNVPENVSVYNHLPAAELEEKIRNASLVIARCGYSTVMDLTVLKKRSILIPTPGQTEQEYLAGYLMKRSFAFCVAQKKFRLKNALALAENFPYQSFEGKSNGLQAAVHALIRRIESKEKSNL
ncbi:glycosyltransferase [Flavisolibacter ginsenosidimutans]|uniref:Glycosyl transferase family 28 n=1 Tax=Flavisolibacter ginsenosidimutans TaxID=661481 RepID=A0A5B8UMF6_9BACT|nr:glycosyltransferase [Flavisolibacter ginsenosidimutans]QEC57250.1 glycosyl transferase family 28 [Flavisolibacter ginsenosidimutans]